MSAITSSAGTLRDRAIYGLVAEFETAQGLIHAGHELHHTHGYSKLDALTPFPVHGIDDAIGVPPSILGYIVFCFGCLGLTLATTLIWYTGSIDSVNIPVLLPPGYRLVIGGKPLFAVEFSVPIMFELTVLLSAFCAVFGMLALNKLPQFYHPSMNYERFGVVTDDRYLLVVESSDRKFEVDQTRRLLESLGAANTQVLDA
ncbi:MAG TPA: DUF3341 domain-containing protein [Bryobacteraceae bacterium]|nr:DUF3341 domain-containing protein [Bryobacteraceae bacterium]